MKIRLKSLILLLYSIGMLVVILRGILVYELGMQQFITGTGQLVSLIEISISILLLLILNKIKSNKRIVEITKLRWALILLWLTQVALDLINSKTVNMSILYFALMILLLLTIEYNEDFFEKLLKITFNTFLLLCIISLIFMFRGYGIQTNGEYLIVSSIGIRLYGVTQHANTLGAIAALVCVYSYYNRKKLPFIIGLITLWYTQSKTNIFILVICLALDLFFKFLRFFNKKKIKYLYATFVTGGIFTAFMAIYYFILLQVQFTGRTKTWTYFISAWKSSFKNFIIGCDSSLISLYKYAENMYVDMLTRYGIIGLIILLYLIYTIFSISLKNMEYGYPISFSVSIFIALRCITESIFINTNMGFGDFFNLAFLIIIYETYMRRFYGNRNRISIKYSKEEKR